MGKIGQKMIVGVIRKDLKKSAEMFQISDLLMGGVRS